MMKGELSVWYLILIALGVLSMMTVMYVADMMIEDTFISALEHAFE